jgi:hypothetical protein
MYAITAVNTAAAIVPIMLDIAKLQQSILMQKALLCKSLARTAAIIAMLHTTHIITIANSDFSCGYHPFRNVATTVPMHPR